jgi:arylsulfatase A-like enzyme
LVGGAAGVAALSAGAAVANGLPAHQRPNIIMFLADDMGVADASCYGAPQIKTPAIDEIAADGARFTQAYANSAVCTASRVGLITGRYQYRLAVGLEEPLGPRHIVGLPPGQPTLPSLLKKAGYATSLIGKWHLGDLPDYGPLKSGYDHFWGFRGGALDYFSHQMFGKADLWDGDTPITEHGYLTDMIGRRTVEIVNAQTATSPPFFVSVHFNSPHWPWEGPGDEGESKRIGTDTADNDGGTLETYNRMVEAMDRQIGLVLEALAQTGQRDNTIVLFTSDNGGERFSNTWPFTGKKSELLEGGLRIPSVIRWPDHIPRGMANAQTMIHMDWLPTLLSAAGTAPDPNSPSDGISLLPTLTEGAPPIPRRLFWRYKANAQRAVRDGDFKALKIADHSYLFNVVDDPLERANLKERLPDVYRRLTAEWNAWNATMLPEDPRSFTYNNTGADWADHLDNPEIGTTAVDSGGPWPNNPLSQPHSPAK